MVFFGCSVVLRPWLVSAVMSAASVSSPAWAAADAVAHAFNGFSVGVTENPFLFYSAFCLAVVAVFGR